MTAQTRTTLKAYFEMGDKPTQGQFADTIDSYLSLIDPTAQSVVSDVSFGGAFSVSGKSTLPSILTTTVSAQNVYGQFNGTLGTTLPVASGGTGITASDPVVQRVSTNTAAVATGATTIPLDDTIPQSTEGNQYFSLAITPKNSANILVIEALLNLSNSAVANFSLIAALFQDATGNALSAVATTASVSTGIYQLSLKWIMAAGTTSATTFKVRAGANAAGTTTLNGQAAARLFGGSYFSWLTITEYST